MQKNQKVSVEDFYLDFGAEFRYISIAAMLHCCIENFQIFEFSYRIRINNVIEAVIETYIKSTLIVSTLLALIGTGLGSEAFLGSFQFRSTFSIFNS